MLTNLEAQSQLLSLLQKKSVKYGDFTLSSGIQSKYYIDCKLTTLDPQGAWLVGQVMHSIIRRHAASLNLQVQAVGGLTLGADAIAQSIGMFSFMLNETPPLQMFVVRKMLKAHGQGKLIEGNFCRGDNVVIIDDVITGGASTIQAIDAVRAEGGTVAFVAALVDRQQGGRENIEKLGCSVISAFLREELIQLDAKPPQATNCVAA